MIGLHARAGGGTPAVFARASSLAPWLGLLLCFGVATALVIRAAQSQGYLWADDYVHLLISKSVPADPRVVLDVWGRPLMTLAYVPAALTGEWAVRLTSLLLLFGTATSCWAIARDRGAAAAPIAALFLLAQPLTATLGFSALPATVFSFVLGVALWLRGRQRPAEAALVASLLPLARLEGFLVLLVWGLGLARERRWRLAPALLAGTAAWALIAANIFGDPLWLPHHNPYWLVGTSQPAGWTFLAHAWSSVFGPVVGGLALVAFARPRSGEPLIAHITVAFTLFFFLAWGLEAFGLIPNGTYLVDASVPVALMAHQGLVSAWKGERLALAGAVGVLLLALAADLLSPGAANLVQLAVVGVMVTWASLRLERRAIALGLSALVGLAALWAAVQVRPLPLEGEPLLARQLAERLAAAHERVDVFSQPAFAWYAWELDARLGDRFLSGSLLRVAIESAPVGTRVVWDTEQAAPYASEAEMHGWGYRQETAVDQITVWVRMSAP